MPARRLQKAKAALFTEEETSGVWEPKDIVNDYTETELDEWMSSSSFGSELKNAERALARLAEEQERLRLLAQCHRSSGVESGRIRVEPPPPPRAPASAPRPAPRRRKRAVRD